nr:palmitoyltransferase ZDHHC13 isoform X2 [Paramormyrops kingsleyae]
MDWNGQNECSTQNQLGSEFQEHGAHCQGLGAHGHGHGQWHGHNAMVHGFMSGMSTQFGPGPDITMDPTKQPKRRPHLDDSSSWDIVKATQFGILDRCKELVDAGYDVRQPDKENVTLLHWAAINNRAEIVKYYISKGAIVDQLGGDLNSTPLHWAIRQGHLPMVILLMRHGADPSLSDGEGFCSLHLAVLFQHMPIAAYLMAKGQEVDCPDLNGQTPLMLAAQKIIGPEPTNFLIKCNASVSAVDKMNRNSPLHCAILAGNVDAVHILLEAGASVDLQNAKGQTPIDLANQVHSPLLVHMLNHVKQERMKANSTFFHIVKRYRFHLLLVFCTAVLWAVGAITDLNSESWLLKGVLLASVLGMVNLIIRFIVGPDVNKLLPATFLMASVFLMLFTWCFWLMPGQPTATVKILFSLNAAGLFYYYYRSCRTDPGYIKTPEEERKKVLPQKRNVIMLAEAGYLDPRVFCTSCMMQKPIRANHCFSCDSCIAKQDHHSVWINGCIGARNHSYFVLFLFFLCLFFCWILYGSLIYWSKSCQLNYTEGGAWGVLTALASCSPWLLYMFALTFFHTSWSSAILMMQLYQIAVYGLTTPERIYLMQRRRKLPQSVSLRQNPYNLGFVRNLVNFFQLRCCGLCKPVVVDWTQQFSLGSDYPMLSGFNTV